MFTRTLWLTFPLVLWLIRPTLLAAYAVLCFMATLVAVYLNSTEWAVQGTDSMPSTPSVRWTAT